MNLCRSCGQDFASVRLFGAHRIGGHDYTYSEGVKMEPMREDGRRCLGVDEMQAKGWALDARGRWSDPAKIAADADRLEALAA
jgi:hypothetical protein